jgi:CRP-like cAMP-binding protein
MRPERRFVDLTERMIYLRSIPVAAMLPPPVLKAIAAYLRERTFEAGELLMRVGEPIMALQLLTEGKLALVRGGTEMGTLAPPQSLGFMGILARSDGTYDATAVTRVRSLELASDALLELLEDHFPLLHATLTYLAERLLYELMELPPAMLGFPFEPPLEVGDRPIDLVEEILLLRRMSGFKRTNVNALAALSRQLREVRYPAGTQLWKRGEPAESALFIASGVVVCHKEAGEWRYGPGTAAGGIENLAGKPRWYDASAETALVALEGRGEGMIDLFEDSFSMGMDFVSMMAEALSGILERKAALGQQPLQVLRNVSKLGAVPVGA